MLKTEGSAIDTSQADTIASAPAADVGKPLAAPIVAVSGRWGKTITARLLEALVSATHPRRAVWTEGVWVNKRRLPGELIAWTDALRMLGSGELDLAIQELDAPTVVAAGLPTQAYRVGIITSFCGNDATCLASPRSLMERKAQLAVARSVHPQGVLVLNADDLAVADEAGETEGEPIYFGASRRNPIIRSWLREGGRAVCIANGTVVLCTGRQVAPVLPVRDIAITQGGMLAFQVHNALAAVTAAWALGVSVEKMVETLRTFHSSPWVMPGSCNQLTINGATVLVDRWRDPVSARLLIRGARRITNRRRRRLLLPAALGEDAAAAEEIGRLAGSAFDMVLIQHQAPVDKRVVDALRAGLSHNLVPPMVLNLPDEAAALDKLVEMLKPADQVVIFGVDLALVLRTLVAY